jgi:hypothetical protein
MKRNAKEEPAKSSALKNDCGTRLVKLQGAVFRHKNESIAKRSVWQRTQFTLCGFVPAVDAV